MEQTRDQGKLWLVDLLWDLGAIELGIFNLGNTAVNSPIYINAKIPLLRPGPLKKIVNLLNQEIELIKSRRDDSIDNFDIIAGVPVGGLILATALGLEKGQSTIYVRKNFNANIEDVQQIEGSYLPGQTVLIIDDLTTGGHSIKNCIETLRYNGLYVKNAITLIDRAEGSTQLLQANGVKMHSIINLETIAVYLRETQKISNKEYVQLRDYIEKSK
ncbi:MAG: phosphoribosyltransferase [Chloroflexi bacterium]|nr:phosphoribosyltransferase [Chloroflexota bacterium]|tara:strand:+ start:1007 stop:1654 length:648 start_codon:yes stop_codon:yes gene_type:complete